MTESSLEAALRAGADGLYALEAGVIHIGDSITNPGTALAVIDWEAAIAALDAGECPGSSGDEKILRLAASLAADVPVKVGDAVIGLDDDNVALLVKAILHASDQRQFHRQFWH